MSAIGSIDTYDAEDWTTISISLGETPDPAEMESEIKRPLSERVVENLTSKKTARYQLDGCLNIEGPTELYRQNVIQSLQNQSNWMLASSVILAIMLGTTIEMTSQKIQSLNSPIYQKPAEQRALGYQKSFPAVYALGLDNKGVFHPNEVEYLYKKHLNAFCQGLLQENPSTDKEKKEWLDKFFTLNPLSPLMQKCGLNTSLKQLGEEYDRLFPERMSYYKLYLKFGGPIGSIGSIGPIGRTGMYPTPYLYDLEGLSIVYERKLEDLRIDYLTRKEELKSHYRCKISPESSLVQLKFLNDQYEYDLKTLKDHYIAKSELLKAKYPEDLKELKSQFEEPHFLEERRLEKGLEERLERKFAEIDAIFIENKNLVYRDGLYEDGKNLLELAIKELNQQ